MFDESVLPWPVSRKWVSGARIADGLPLAATMQEDEQSGRNILEYQNQAKMLFRKLGPQSPNRCSIETGRYLFHYLIENEVCYLVLCERNYSKRVAYSYLEDIAQEFHSLYGKRVNTVTRPYSFIEFDTYIQKAKKVFLDGRSRRNMNALNSQLQDVQRIMVQNIDDVLQRGTVLSELDTKTQNLSMLSQKYKKDAAHLNSKSMYVKAVAGLIAVLVFLLYFFVL
ncbi:vesicle-trafficking protein SEC22 isoform X1 [Calliopsis andreniformis]|uniref:vesicle-trafficking protein SEC22 isoform X1 n=1 Tax=Calliopsis andreniformis TaxID=337506 RepID=UPI003FCC9F6E